MATWLGKADETEHFLCLFAGFLLVSLGVDQQRFADLIADRVQW